jgi:hypothetical protein
VLARIAANKRLRDALYLQDLAGVVADRYR